MTLDDLPFTAFDLAVLGVVALSTVLALVRGAAREVLAVVAWVGAFAVAYYGFAEVRAVLARTVEGDLVADGLTLAVVFLIPLVVFKIVTVALARRVQGGVLGSFDRLAGAAFGVARGVLIVCLAYLGLSLVIDPDDHPRWVRDSHTLPYVRDGVTLLRGLVPEDLGERGSEATREALNRAARDLPQGGAAGDAARRLLGPGGDAAREGDGFGYAPPDADAMDRLIRGRLPGDGGDG
ncbi:MAG TPA: CvpA family protein [Geminicoccaceae bacterium]|nr:CvpA family protein [Geminicoccaceae bacterium]